MRTKFFGLVLFVVLILSSVFMPITAQEDSLNILYWQAASSLNPYVSGGTKEYEAASLVLEPLAEFSNEGILVPALAAEIPTVENGGVAEDLTSITWTLKEGVVWSDGTPFTAEDVVFTAQYCMEPGTGCASLNFYNDIVSVEALDDQTVQVTFSVPKPNPYGAFVSAQAPIIQKAQFEDCIGANAAGCSEENFNPIGTGPYAVQEFRANDVVVYVANENYRVEGKPYFSTVTIKGGGDAESSARAVLETGEADYAWNLQIAPSILDEMQASGEGTVVVAFSNNVEVLFANQTNPAPDLGDERSVWHEDGSNAHPFLTDPTVYQALSMAIDRNVIAEQLYGAAGQAACNIISAPAIMASTANDSCFTQDIEGANALLDEAGIVDSDGDGIREKDGVPLSLLFQTSTNAVRQSTQALIKQWWSEIGVETELRSIDASVFFGGDVASPDTYGKFYADIQMYTNLVTSPDPETALSRLQCSEISGPDNNWLGSNAPRWCNPEYDVILEELSRTAGFEQRAELIVQLNDLVVQGGVLFPLVRRGTVSAHGNDIEGVLINPWDSELWNIEDWSRS